jgi:hypothetical protein
MIIVDASGNSNKIALYRSLPFVLVQKEVKNSSAQEVRIAKEQLFEGKINLGNASEKLKNISTAGLHALTRPKGGYFFMAVGIPSNYEGVIYGWLSASVAAVLFFLTTAMVRPLSVPVSITAICALLPASQRKPKFCRWVIPLMSGKVWKNTAMPLPAS